MVFGGRSSSLFLLNVTAQAIIYRKYQNGTDVGPSLLGEIYKRQARDKCSDGRDMGQEQLNNFKMDDRESRSKKVADGREVPNSEPSAYDPCPLHDQGSEHNEGGLPTKPSEMNSRRVARQSSRKIYVVDTNRK